MRKTKKVLDAEQRFNQLKKKSDKEKLTIKEKEELRECLRAILMFYDPRS